MCRLILFCFLMLSACKQKTEVIQEKQIPVVVAEVTKEDIPIYLETIGTIFSPTIVHIRPQVQGEITKIHVRQGQWVKKGQLLYTIDPSTYKAEVQKQKAAIEKDKASLLYAKQKLERYSQLKDKNFVSPLTLEEYASNVAAAEAQILTDQAALDLAIINLHRTNVRSPIEGKISQFNIDLGNVVKAFDESALTEVLQMKPLEVRFSFPQKDFLEIKKFYSHGKMTFKAQDSLDKENIEQGTVDFLDNKFDTRTGTILLKGEVPNTNENFWPGSFVKVQVFLKTANDVLVAPTESVILGQKGPIAFVVNEDLSVSQVSIKTGSQYENKTIIEEGLKEGDKVVVQGQLNLQSGTKVNIKK